MDHNATYWNKCDELLQTWFKSYNYNYHLPSVVSPSRFHRTVIFDNGEKYCIIWDLVNDAWEILFVGRKEKTIFIPMGTFSSAEIPEAELKCKQYYIDNQCVPLKTYSQLA